MTEKSLWTNGSSRWNQHPLPGVTPSTDLLHSHQSHPWHYKLTTPQGWAAADAPFQSPVASSVAYNGLWARFLLVKISQSNYFIPTSLMYSAQPLEACPRGGSFAMVKVKDFFSGGHDELQLKIKLLVVAACPVRASLAGSTAIICRLCCSLLPNGF